MILVNIGQIGLKGKSFVLGCQIHGIKDRNGVYPPRGRDWATRRKKPDKDAGLELVYQAGSGYTFRRLVGSPLSGSI